MSAFLNKHRITVIALCLAILTFVVFFQVTGHEFLNYDDGLYVADNLHVRGGLSGENLAWAFTTFRAGNWHPLTWISLMLDASVFGLEPMGFHLMNVLLHIANVLLLFFLLNRMTGRMWRSAFAAALFAVHPLHVESVAWLAERKDVLSTLFWLLTMLAYVQYSRRPSAVRYAGVAALLALGLMAKPMLVMLPLVLLLIDYWPLRRTGTSRTTLIVEKVPLLILSAASCIVTYAAQHSGGAVAALERIPLGLRISNALVSCMLYIGKTLVPAGLAVFYPYSRSLPVWEVLASVVILAAITFLVLRSARSRPHLTVGWLWFIITLIPVIGLVQVGQQSMADRYTYVPLVGLFIAVTWGASERMGEWMKGRVGEPRSPILPFPLSPALCLSAIAVLSVISWRQVGFWQDNETLFTRALAVTERNHLAHTNLGVALFDAGKLEEAREHFTRAVEIKPNEAVAQSSLGTVLMQLDQPEEAIEHLQAAVRLNNRLEEAHNSLGILLAAQGQSETAIAHYRQALLIDPENTDVHFNLAVALAASNKLEEAAAEYNRVIRLCPDDAGAHNNLGTVLVRLGRTRDAVSEFKEALRLDPGSASAMRNLQQALGGKVGPDAASERRLGDEAMQQSNWNGAIEHYALALEATPDNSETRNNLAAAYFLNGMYDKAWEQVRICRKRGGTPKPELVKLLSEKMPEPR